MEVLVDPQIVQAVPCICALHVLFALPGRPLPPSPCPSLLRTPSSASPSWLVAQNCSSIMFSRKPRDAANGGGVPRLWIPSVHGQWGLGGQESGEKQGSVPPWAASLTLGNREGSPRSSILAADWVAGSLEERKEDHFWKKEEPLWRAICTCLRQNGTCSPCLPLPPGIAVLCCSQQSDGSLVPLTWQRKHGRRARCGFDQRVCHLSVLCEVLGWCPGFLICRSVLSSKMGMTVHLRQGLPWGRRGLSAAGTQHLSHHGFYYSSRNFLRCYAAEPDHFPFWWELLTWLHEVGIMKMFISMTIQDNKFRTIVSLQN